MVATLPLQPSEELRPSSQTSTRELDCIVNDPIDEKTHKRVDTGVTDQLTEDIEEPLSEKSKTENYGSRIARNTRHRIESIFSDDNLLYTNWFAVRNTYHHPPNKLLNPPLAGAFAACGSGVAALFSSSNFVLATLFAGCGCGAFTSFVCVCAFTGAGATGAA